MTLRFCVLTGSPRLHGNTAKVLAPFLDELALCGAEVSCIHLDEQTILPCRGCHACQQISGRYGCIINDDVAGIMDTILASDCIVLATPIYAWYCTAPMKALLDRHYGMNKYYGTAPRVSLWAGRSVALITTHGYDADYANEPFETGIKRLCKHSNLNYAGLYSVRHEAPGCFRAEAAVTGARAFARELMACNAAILQTD